MKTEKAIAILFAEWLRKNGYEPCTETHWAKFGSDAIRCSEYYTESELYDIAASEGVFKGVEEPINECYFIPCTNISSATICANCGKEKGLHTIGQGYSPLSSETTCSVCAGTRRHICG